MTVSAYCLVLALTTVITAGETLIIPGGAESRENTSGTPYPFSAPDTIRSQQIYENSLFPQLANGRFLQIEAITFRLATPGSFGGATQADFDRVHILLSSAFGPFTLNLEANHGANVATVYDGPKSLGGTVPPGTAPSAFELRLPFEEPFLYDPKAGDLIVEIRKFGPENLTVGLGTARIAGLTFYWETGFGVDGGGNLGLETLFSYQVVPEPGVKAILLMGLVVLLRSRKRL